MRQAHAFRMAVACVAAALSLVACAQTRSGTADPREATTPATTAVEAPVTADPGGNPCAGFTGDAKALLGADRTTGLGEHKGGNTGTQWYYFICGYGAGASDIKGGGGFAQRMTLSYWEAGDHYATDCVDTTGKTKDPELHGAAYIGGTDGYLDYTYCTGTGEGRVAVTVMNVDPKSPGTSIESARTMALKMAKKESALRAFGEQIALGTFTG